MSCDDDSNNNISEREKQQEICIVTDNFAKIGSLV